MARDMRRQSQSLRAHCQTHPAESIPSERTSTQESTPLKSGFNKFSVIDEIPKATSSTKSLDPSTGDTLTA
jgi:hypothetical protein